KGDVGLVLSKRAGYIAVVSALPGSPAAQAGVASGDFIETIKGVATRDMPLAYAEQTLQGDPGTTIEISLFKRRPPEPAKGVVEGGGDRVPAGSLGDDVRRDRLHPAGHAGAG